MIFLNNDIFEHNQLKNEGKANVMIIEEIVHKYSNATLTAFLLESGMLGIKYSSMSSDGFNINL
jgi:hypothetical protein